MLGDAWRRDGGVCIIRYRYAVLCTILLYSAVLYSSDINNTVVQ